MSDDSPGFIEELKRRKVFRVAVIYGLVGWGVFEVAEAAFPRLGLPDWTVTLVLMLGLLGFPVALVLAWALEVTPEGVKRTPAAPGKGPSWLGPVGLVVVGALLGIGGWTLLGPDPGPDDGGAGADEPIRSLAVLPFADMSADASQEYFSDGVAEEILNGLAQIDQLKVAARTSSFAFKGRDQDVRAIADSLNVQAILEGSVRKAGERVRVTAQLIDAREGYHLWSETYDRRLEDIFAIQDEIARSITDALRVELLGQETERLVRKGTDDLEAHDLYLQGVFEMNQRSVPALKRAVEHFEAAISRDSSYAEAWGSLAQAHYLLPIYGSQEPREYHVERAREAARRALELDPESAEAHAALGGVLYQFDWDFDAAEAEFRKAIEANPSYGFAHHWLGEMLVMTGRHEEGMAEMRRALEVDPMSPVINAFYAMMLHYTGRSQEALRHIRQVRARNPDYGLSAALEEGVLVYLGRYEDVLEVLDSLPEDSLSQVGRARRLVLRYKVGEGSRQEALAAVREMTEEGYQSWRLPTTWFVLLGEEDRAIQHLRTALENRDPTLPFATDPILEPLFDDPRYREIMMEMGIPRERLPGG